MLTALPLLGLLKNTCALFPLNSSRGSFRAPKSWQRLSINDIFVQQHPWFSLPSPALPSPVPHRSRQLDVNLVLDRGFFFPLPPQSPFAHIVRTPTIKTPALAKTHPAPFRAYVAKTLRPRKKKSAALGLTPAFFDEALKGKGEKKHPRRKHRRLVRALTRRANRPALLYPCTPVPSFRKPTTLPPLSAKCAKLVLPELPVKSLTPLYFIPQTRFKPGFRAQWRLLRYDFARTVGVRATRQVRITRYAAKLRALSGFNFVLTLSMTAGFVLRQARLNGAPAFGAPFYGSLQRVFNTAWLLNGALLPSPYLQLYPGDLLAQTSLPLFTDWRGNHARWAQNNRLRQEGLARVFAQRATTAAPWFLEVDELTQTIAVVASPQKISDLDPMLWQAFPFLTHKMLNWKYRH